MTQSARILVVDDEPQIRSLLEEFLTGLGYSVDVAADGEQALQHLRTSSFSGVLADVKMAKLGGVELLKRIKVLQPALPVVMITGYPSVEIAVEAMKEGAADFITKPLRLDELRMVLTRITRNHPLEPLGTGGTVHSTLLASSLHSPLPGKIKELSILYAISEAFQNATDTEEIFQRLVNVSREIVGAYSSSFTLFDFDQQNISLKTFHSSDQGNYNPFHSNLQIHILNKLLKEEKPVFLDKPFNSVVLPILIKNQILGALTVSHKKDELPFTEEDVLLILTLCRKAALSVENQFLYEGLYQNLLETLKTLVMMLEARDPYTGAHSQRVSRYATSLAAKIGCSREEQDIVMAAGFLHDIGKIGICDEILLKTEPLTPTEYEVIKTHPIIGEQIIQHLALFTREKAIIRHHHEWWDGRGYPDGLMHHQIPFLARIVTVADAFDAITTNRPYHMGRSFREGLAELEYWAGSQFDTEMVAAFRYIVENDCAIQELSRSSK